MKKYFLGLLPLSFVSSVAMAQNAYVGADLAVMDVEISAEGFSQTYSAEPTAVRARGGFEFTPNIALEGYVGVGLGDDTFEDTSLDVELDSMFGANAVGILPFNDVFAVFAKAGLVAIEYTDSDDDNYEDTGFSYGFGARFNTGRVGAVTVEYSVLPDAINDEYGFDIEIESSMLAVGYQFNL